MATTDTGIICDVSTCLVKAQWRVKAISNSLWRDLCTPHFAALVTEEETEQVLRLPVRQRPHVTGR